MCHFRHYRNLLVSFMNLRLSLNDFRGQINDGQGNGYRFPEVGTKYRRSEFFRRKQ